MSEVCSACGKYEATSAYGLCGVCIRDYTRTRIEDSERALGLLPIDPPRRHLRELECGHCGKKYWSRASSNFLDQFCSTKCREKGGQNSTYIPSPIGRSERITLKPLERLPRVIVGPGGDTKLQW
jgi:hypothetical protein